VAAAASLALALAALPLAALAFAATVAGNGTSVRRRASARRKLSPTPHSGITSAARMLEVWITAPAAAAPAAAPTMFAVKIHEKASVVVPGGATSSISPYAHAAAGARVRPATAMSATITGIAPAMMSGAIPAANIAFRTT
jgi:hypothetical protein